MALNTTLDRSSAPIPRIGEIFIYSQDCIHFQVESGPGYPGLGGNYYSNGTIFLSNLRIVFVPSRPQPIIGVAGQTEFRSFVMELSRIYNERFNQPIFGANNFMGTVQNVSGGGLLSPGNFKITFKNGGESRFVELFYHFIEEIRRNPPIEESNLSTNPIPFVTELPLTEAFIDPNDPTKIYVPAQSYHLPTYEEATRNNS